ncbi:PH domain-containing protein [Stratiformator vulcanicus]|uniref:Bacterial membrane flanked domain protein n=1 Tax=Stratiformator vulcanicus TaxID=2527980 RepID=A0A517R5N9_9PLAN|nr:PH domain-containing protein [Stratiformator vulcanicus]QDT39170.1 Bacterial membrane flanked domain protein [Stratiformator vulcanicus]
MSTENDGTIIPKSDKLFYRCPNCTEKVVIDESLVGEVVDCPIESCSTPFLAVAPKGEIIGRVKKGEDVTNLPLVATTMDRSAAASESRLTAVHPAMLRANPILFVIYVIAIVGGLIAAVGLFATGGAVLAVIPLGIAVAAAIAWGVWYLKVISTTLIVTTKRTVLRHGILKRDINEVQHDDVRNIQVNQNMIQRLFDIGDIAISSSGQDDLEIMVTGIADPDEITEVIRRYQ